MKKLSLHIISLVFPLVFWGQDVQVFDLAWESSLQDGTQTNLCDYCTTQDNQPYFIYSYKGIDSVTVRDVKFDNLLGSDVLGLPEFKVNLEKIVSGTDEVINVRVPAFYKDSEGAKKLTSLTLNVYKSLQDNQRIKKSNDYASTSKLSVGKWFKLKIGQSGVYKLSSDYLRSLGLNLSAIDPKKIKIYGSGGYLLPQVNTADREDDLVENAIYVSAVGTTFGVNDFVLFYAEAPHKLTYDTSSQVINHQRNIYSDYSYYYLTVDGSEGLRVDDVASEGAGSVVISRVDALSVAEEDLENALNSGRNWYWKNFDNQKTQYYDIATPGKINSTEFTFISKVMAQAYAGQVSFLSKLGTVEVNQNVSKNSVSSKGYGVTGYEQIEKVDLNFATLNNQEDFRVEVTFTGDANSDRNDGLKTHGFLDYATIQYRQVLGGIGMQVFSSFESLNQKKSKYRVKGNADTKVWDVTNHKQPLNRVLSYSDNYSEFVEDSDELKKYITFSVSNTLTPSSFEEVSNQDLHGINVPDLVIIAPKVFSQAAQELQAYRESQGYDVFLTTPDLIYNEFSSGVEDISAIRNFLKMLYDQSPSKIKYLVLFGGASFDYKDVISDNTNFVPTYQSIESLHNVESYGSDDYYGFLTDGDGEWAENSSGNHDMVLNVGRIPALSIQEAEATVAKIKLYENTRLVNGAWKNRVALIADDGDNNLHLRDAEKLAELINDIHPQVHLSKLYLDAYEQYPVSGSREDVPGFEKAFGDFLEEGGLIVNFTGHGSPVQWGNEFLISMDKINAMTNLNKLPIYLTATCDFGVFDNPKKKSGAMTLVTKPNGGAIAAVTTTRAVYASSNFVINEKFYRNLFARASDSSFVSLGDVYRKTKNESKIDVNNRGFSLLGDPCLRITFPENKLKIEMYNGNQVSSQPDTLKALSINRIEGKVVTSQETDMQLDGVMRVTIYDKPADKITLGSIDSPYKYQERTNLLYDGYVSVVDGVFEVEFPLSKDISYNYEIGKVMMYTYDTLRGLDAQGVFDNLVIGGTSDDVVDDNDGPTADLFLNDETFESGGYTHDSPFFIANLEDDNGINISSTSVGHEITMTLDGDNTTTKILNGNYIAELDNYQKGRVTYQMEGLARGEHTIEFVAWDTHNNPVVEELAFFVGDKVTFFNYPNPFSDETRFKIQHSNGGKDLQLRLNIFDPIGQLVTSKQYTYKESPSVIDNITWYGTLDGQVCSSGVYVVKIELYYPETLQREYQITKAVLTH